LGSTLGGAGGHLTPFLIPKLDVCHTFATFEV
jgi:hypothetical protein